jgi:WD40 repeat protein
MRAFCNRFTLGDRTTMPRLVFAILAGLLLASAAQAQPAVDALGDPLPPGAVARLGTLRLKHPKGPPLSYSNIPWPTVVSGVRFSADGSKFVSRANPNRTICVWDAVTGKVIAGDWDRRVYWCEGRMAFSPDGTVLAVHAADLQHRDGDKAVLLWDVATGKFLRSLPEDKYLRSLEFADDGKTLVTTHEDAVRWWDVATGKEWRSWKPFGPAADRDRDDGQPTRESHLVVSAGARYLLATVWRRGAEDKLLPGEDRYLFELPTGRECWHQRNEKAGQVGSWLSADNKLLARLYGATRLDLHDAASGKRLWTLPLEQHFAKLAHVNGIALSADGQAAAVADPDGRVYLWCARDRKWRTYDIRMAHWMDHSSKILAFSPDASRLVVCAGADLQVVDVATMKEVHAFDGHRGWVDYLAFSADGKRLLTGSAQSDLHPREVATWDTATWKRLQLSSDQTAPWANVGIASPEHTVYLGKAGDDRLNVYDFATGKRLGRLQVPGQLHEEARGFFAPGGRFFVSFCDANDCDAIALLYAVPSGKLVCKLPKYYFPDPAAIRPVAFSADGRLVAVYAMNGAIYLLDADTGKQVGRLGAEGAVEQADSTHLVFSPDGKHLAAWNGFHHTIDLWDVQTGKKWLTLPDAAGAKYHGMVYFAWSPDSRALAVAADDKIYVWELATQKLRCVLRGHQAEVRSVAFSPDGRLLASGSVDTTVLVWDVTGRAGAMPVRLRRELHTPAD